MLVRLKDNDSLSDFGLVFDGLRLKMSFSPGRELIRPSEVQLLEQLAGMSQKMDATSTSDT
jgi:hypothetical protein